MHDAVVSKLIAASRGSPCDSMASCNGYNTIAVALYCVKYGWTMKTGPVVSLYVKIEARCMASTLQSINLHCRTHLMKFSLSGLWRHTDRKASNYDQDGEDGN